MKKALNYSVLLYLLTVYFVIPPNESKSQLRDYPFKLGFHANYVLAANEYEDSGLLFLLRGYGRGELSKTFQLEGGIGYGVLQGDDYGGNDYMTRIIPVDLRLLYMPFELESWNPYLYVGAGGVAWWVADSPRFPKYPPEDELTGFTALGEIGLGAEFALSSQWSFELTAGYNIMFDDKTNGNSSNLQDDFLHDYDRYINLGLGFNYVIEGCDTDNDNDGLTKCEEDELGTDPNNADSDGDGLNDGDEFKKYGTDPLNTDSDGDGLSDYEEVITHKSNPNKTDTDGDGLNDGDEVNKYNTDPTNADTDGDGLNDGDEVHKYETDPTKADTDGDGLNDGAEVNKYKTDPNNTDTDGDGLTDGKEVSKIKSDPLVVDTDKGSVGDGVEVDRGTNPLDPADDVRKMVDVTFEPILFDFDKSVVKSSEADKLKKVVQFMRKNADVDLIISGYTDAVGPNSYNKKLSDKRSAAVKKWLTDKGIDADRLKTKAFGQDNPVADNSTKLGRKQNRRAELKTKDME